MTKSKGSMPDPFHGGRGLDPLNRPMTVETAMTLVDTLSDRLLLPEPRAPVEGIVSPEEFRRL